MLLNSLIYLLYLSCHYYLQILKLVNSNALKTEPQSKYLTLNCTYHLGISEPTINPPFVRDVL